MRKRYLLSGSSPHPCPSPGGRGGLLAALASPAGRGGFFVAVVLLLPALAWAHGGARTAALEVGGGAVITVSYNPPHWGPKTFGMIQRGEGDYASEFVKPFAEIELPAAYRWGGTSLAAGSYQLAFRSEAGKMWLRLVQDGQTRAEVPVQLEAGADPAEFLTIELQPGEDRAVHLILLYGPHRAVVKLEGV